MAASYVFWTRKNLSVFQDWVKKIINNALRVIHQPTILFTIIYAHYSTRNAGKYFIGDGIQLVGQYGYRIIIPKNNYLIALFGINIGEVNHTHIHAYISY